MSLNVRSISRKVKKFKNLENFAGKAWQNAIAINIFKVYIEMESGL